MNEMSAWMARAQEGPEAARKAVPQLAALGVPAVDSISQAIRESHTSIAFVLRQVFFRIKDPEIIPAMISLMRDQNDYVRSAAIARLGYSRDQRSYEPLLGELLDAGNLESVKAWAAKALGNLGDRRAIEVLLGLIRKLAGPDLVYSAELALEAIVALAKLGNHEMASLALELCRSDDSMVRIDAVKSLKYLMTPGLFAVLVATMRERNQEMRRDSVDALFYLGARESIGELMLLLKDDDHNTRSLVHFRLVGLTGVQYEAESDSPAIESWWVEKQEQLGPGICYRLGKPIRILEIISLTKQKPHLRLSLLEELRLITGTDFGFWEEMLLENEDLEELPQRASDWWGSEGGQFEEGSLYKYGHRQEIEKIFS